jgi:hypothetical protein
VLKSIYILFNNVQLIYIKRFHSRGGDSQHLSYYTTTSARAYQGKPVMPQTNYYNFPWAFTVEKRAKEQRINHGRPSTSPNITSITSDLTSNEINKNLSDSFIFNTTGFTRNEVNTSIINNNNNNNINEQEIDEIDGNNSNNNNNNNTKKRSQSFSTTSQQAFLPKVGFPASTILILPKTVHLESSGYRANIVDTTTPQHGEINHHAPFFYNNPSPITNEKVLSDLKNSDPVNAENQGMGPSPYSTTYKTQLFPKKLNLDLNNVSDIKTYDSAGGFCRNQDQDYYGTIPTEDYHKRPNSHYDFTSPSLKIGQRTYPEKLHLEASSYSVNNRQSVGVNKSLNYENEEDNNNNNNNINASVLSRMKLRNPQEYKSYTTNTRMKSTTKIDYVPPFDENSGKSLQDVKFKMDHTGFTRNLETSVGLPEEKADYNNNNNNNNSDNNNNNNNNKFSKESANSKRSDNNLFGNPQIDHYNSINTKSYKWPIPKPFLN